MNDFEMFWQYKDGAGRVMRPVPWKAPTAGKTFAGNVIHYSPAEYLRYREALASAALSEASRQGWPLNYRGSVRLDVTFLINGAKRGDRTNLVKSTEDALGSIKSGKYRRWGVIYDDVQVIDGTPRIVSCDANLQGVWLRVKPCEMQVVSGLREVFDDGF